MPHLRVLVIALYSQFQVQVQVQMVSEPALITIAILVASYFWATVPWGLLLAHRKNIDLQNLGSGNIGATNVARHLGKRTGALVLFCDAAKGAIPVAAVLLFDLSARTKQPWLLTWVGLAALIGHCFPVWLRFRGGKGVATSLGIFLIAAPLSATLGVGLFTAVYARSRVASLASISITLAFPGLIWLFDYNSQLLMLSGLSSVLVLANHHANIRRLLNHTELTV